jgi:hypothetical protein
MDGLSEQTFIRDTYAVSDGQIIQSPTTTVGQVKSARNMSVPHIITTTINR